MPVINQQNWKTASVSTPPIPDLTDIAALYSLFGIAAGWQNGSPLANIDGNEIASTAIVPYPLDWGSVIDNTEVSQWIDQSGSSFDALSGVVSPQSDVPAQRFTYDGTQSLVTSSGIISGDKLTIYCVFSTNSLAMAQTLLQSKYDGSYVTTTQNLFAVYLTAAGVLTVSQKTDDLVPVFNTQTKPLSSTGLHLLTVVFDRSVSGAGATVAKLDNAATGWAGAATGNMASNFQDRAIGIALGQPLGSDAFLNGTFNECWIFNGAKDAAHQTSVYDFLKYCYPDLP